MLLVLGLIFISDYDWNFARSSAAEPPPILAAPTFQLKIGANGRLNSTSYMVANHALVEVAGVGGKFQRHEYELTAYDDARRLLVHALDGDSKTWHIFAPVTRPAELTPLAAAAKHPGSTLSYSGQHFSVSGLFLCQPLSREGNPTSAPPGLVRYGFIARAGADVLMARWSETVLELHLSRVLGESDARAAFGYKPAAGN
jgi:hypothetical protein